ncbi:MAG: hypothetical protein ACJ8AG_23255 [Ktedonobacteraceae bacterium]
MFEALFTIDALIESNGQGQRIFKIFRQGEPLNDAAFSSFLATVYQQEVYRTLQAGDSLTITVHIEPPWREVERTVHFREDQQFEGEGVQKPTADLLPLVSKMYEQFLQQIHPGDVLTVAFRIQRL